MIVAGRPAHLNSLLSTDEVSLLTRGKLPDSALGLIIWSINRSKKEFVMINSRTLVYPIGLKCAASFTKGP